MIIVSFCVSLSGQSDERSELGFPPHVVFSKSDIGFTPDVSCFAWDAHGVLYCGERNGILRYDGIRWARLNGIEEDLMALAISADGTIYYSHFKGFGSIEYQADGSLKETDLLGDHADGLNAVPQVKRILISDTHVHFVSVDAIFSYELESGTVRRELAASHFSSNAVLYEGKLMVTDSSLGLVALEYEGLVTVAGGASFAGDSSIVSLVSGLEARLYGLAKDGRFIEFDGKQFRTLKELGRVRGRGMRHLVQLGDGGFVFADGSDIVQLSSGLAIEARLGQLVSNYSLRTVAMELSPNGRDLWVSFGSSIARLDLDSPATHFGPAHGVTSAVRKAVRFEGSIYLETNLDLRRGQYDSLGRLTGFEPILENLEGSQLLDVCSDGILIRVGDQLMIYNGVEVFSPSERQEALFVSPYSGPYRVVSRYSHSIGIFERQNGVWSAKPTNVDIGALVYNLVEADDGIIWVELGPGHVARVVLENGAYAVRYYDSSHGLTDDWIEICVLDGAVCFVSDKGLLHFDSEREKFLPNSEYDDTLSAIDKPLRLWQDHRKRIWSSSSEGVGVIVSSLNGSMVLDQLSHCGSQEQPPAVVLVESSGKTWLASSAGLLLCESDRIRESNDRFDLLITGVEDLRSGALLASDLIPRDQLSPNSPLLEGDDGSIKISLSSPEYLRPEELEFRYKLLDESDWSDWSPNSAFEFRNLESGDYQFQAQAKNYVGRLSPIARYEFLVEESVYSSGWAYAAYFIGILLIVGLTIVVYSYSLRKRNLALQAQIEDRATSFEEKSNALNVAMTELQETQSKLMASARMAGMAEVATSVLHNVGNVLNSLTISASTISVKINQSKLLGLGKAIELLDKNKDNLVEFLVNDSRGSKLPQYLKNLNEVLLAERLYCLKELESVTEHLNHAGTIIASQQKHARNADVIHQFALSEVVRAASRISVPSRWKKHIEIEIDVPEDIILEMDQHSVLQMVTNFIKNASESIMDAGVLDGRVSIKAEHLDEKQERMRLMVTDNGGGMDAQKLKQVFSMGFTTKNYGHGFGMHGVANAAKAIGGMVKLDSPGIGKGATVTLELPTQAGSVEVFSSI